MVDFHGTSFGACTMQNGKTRKRLLPTGRFLVIAPFPCSRGKTLGEGRDRALPLHKRSVHVVRHNSVSAAWWASYLSPPYNFGPSNLLNFLIAWC